MAKITRLLLFAAVALAFWGGAAPAADLDIWPDGRATIDGQSFRCALGRAGVNAAKREGDGATPVGQFPPRMVLFRPDIFAASPPTKLPVQPLAVDDGWCDDPALAQYNRMVKLPFAGSHEILWRADDRRYDLIVPLGYNDDPPRPGLGSAIFLHVAKDDYEPTSGCVGFAKGDLLAIVDRLGPDSLVRIHAAPAR